MARWILITAVSGSLPSIPSGAKLPRGTTIADTAANALPGDLVWPSVAHAIDPTTIAPLDAAAQALMTQSLIGARTSGCGAGRVAWDISFGS